MKRKRDLVYRLLSRTRDARPEYGDADGEEQGAAEHHDYQPPKMPELAFVLVANGARLGRRR